MKCRIIVLTYNAGDNWSKWIESYKSQDAKNVSCLVIDSSSDDNTVIKSINAGLDVEIIPKEEFCHGRTRNYAYKKSKEFDLIIYMTQDAIFYDNQSLKNIINGFNDINIAISFGRQIPNIGAMPIESHARIYNYPDKSRIVSLHDKYEIGFKITFNSNSFSAYRVAALNDINGFPNNVSFGEDAYVAGKVLLKNWKILYNANSKVYHSHNYTCLQEYKRYKEIGNFHSQNKWIFENFGTPENEGLNFIFSEISYLLSNNKLMLVPYAVLKTIYKYVGYKIGLYSKKDMSNNNE